MRNRYDEIFVAVKTKNMLMESMQGWNQILLFIMSTMERFCTK